MHKFLSEFFADPLLWISLVVQFLLMVGGAGVALAEDWGKKHRSWVLGPFVSLGLVGMGVTAKQAVKSARDNTDLTNALGNLGTSTREISRVTSLNTDLQGQLLTQSQVLVTLAQRNFASAARIEKSTGTISVTVQATHAKLIGMSGKGSTPAALAGWMPIVDKLTGTLREFEREWKYAENQLQLGMDGELHRSGPPELTDQQMVVIKYLGDSHTRFKRAVS